MRIGIVPYLWSDGGQYQYTLALLHALDGWKRDGCADDLVAFTDDLDHPAIASLDRRRWAVRSLTQAEPAAVEAEVRERAWWDRLGRIVSEGPHREAYRRWWDRLGRIVGEGPHREAYRWLRRRFRPAPWEVQTEVADPGLATYYGRMSRWLQRCRVDLMIYPAYNVGAFETGPPYVLVIHDLNHRLHPEFPEVSANGEGELREEFFSVGARHATLLVADSEVGKEDILNCYAASGVTADRINILPFLPASYLTVDVTDAQRQSVRSRYQLPERYLFYPASFFSFKNHARIIQALALLKQEHRLSVPIMFVGSRFDEIRERTFQNVMSLTRQLGLDGHIHCLGYAPDEDMSALYAGAVALVMPTFFGPTIIPVLEAWALGCPVLTSDIRGIREQAGDAALLVDPRSVEAIAEGIHRLWTDDSLRKTLAERGRQRLATYTPDDFRRRLVEILKEAKARVRAQREDHLLN